MPGTIPSREKARRPVTVSQDQVSGPLKDQEWVEAASKRLRSLSYDWREWSPEER